MASVNAFNADDPGSAVTLLRPCNASTAWAEQIVAQRPYAGLEALSDASDAITQALAWSDVEQALAAHPRIGDRPKDAATTEKKWSQGEQSGVAHAEQAVLEGLKVGNAEYEARFGHVYLVCASGRSAGELLDVLRARLKNDPNTEQDVVRKELAAITRLRLEKLFA
jgi:2-oxo-4-hydroxy-4-carboxy-5-ureidoimidazoline decarboxylase